MAILYPDFQFYYNTQKAFPNQTLLIFILNLVVLATPPLIYVQITERMLKRKIPLSKI